jgi:hypothetical protein
LLTPLLFAISVVNYCHSREGGNPAVFQALVRLNKLISTFIDELDPRLHGDDVVGNNGVAGNDGVVSNTVIPAHDCMDAGAITEAGI